MLKTKLNNHDRSNRVPTVMKTKEDNNVIDHIGLVYIGNDTELSGPIKPSAICDKNNTG